MSGVFARGASLACAAAGSRKILMCGCGGAADTLLTTATACSRSGDSPWPQRAGGGAGALRGTAAPSHESASLPRHSALTHWLSPLTEQRRGVWDIFRRVSFGSYAVLNNVGEVSAAQPVPAHIPHPLYAETGLPSPPPASPEVHSEAGLEAMRAACCLAAEVQNAVRENIRAGMTTAELDALVHSKAVAGGAYPSPLNYQGFPKSVCTSVNNVACHGIPDDRPLLDGDIVSVDVTVYLEGYHGDCCETYTIGEVDAPGQHLVRAAQRCRDEAISFCGPGIPFNAIGSRVEKVARQEGVTVVPCFIGHGIGRYFHGPPDIYHCYNYYPGTMEPGMTFTVEPVIAQGKEEVLILEDGWTAVMVDNGRAAQFEHTILITDTGHEILTEYKGKGSH